MARLFIVFMPPLSLNYRDNDFRDSPLQMIYDPVVHTWDVLTSIFTFYRNRYWTIRTYRI